MKRRMSDLTRDKEHTPRLTTTLPNPPNPKEINDMTPDDVPERWVFLARSVWSNALGPRAIDDWRAALAAVAPLIAAAEREACARVCEAWADEVEAKAPQSPTIIQARNHAAAIRARGAAS
jgi:hypothetical protein